jgi:hypothetical protein
MPPQRLCTWHEDTQREARWVVEVIGADGETRQRVAACDRCARDVFRNMKRGVSLLADSFPVLRRLLPSDAVLEFGTLAVTRPA